MRDPIKHAQANKRYREKHPDRVAAQLRRWRERNQKKIKQLRSEYWKINREKILAANKAWSQKNPDKVRKFSREYQRKNPHLRRAAKQIRRARMGNAEVGNINEIRKWEDSRRNDIVQCHWCKRWKLGADCHTDHVMPISKGGSHSLENLVVSCARCNRRKGAKTPKEWRKYMKKNMEKFNHHVRLR